MPEQVQKVIKCETRRGSKPLVEKKRRARINQSLAVLQTLVLANKKKEGYKQSRIEKADILEMTVQYLQRIQKEEKDAVSPLVNGKFRTGYMECVSEVSRYLTSIEKVEGRVHERLREHLMETLLAVQLETERNMDNSEAMDEDPHYLDVRVVDADSRSSPSVSTTTPANPSPTPSQMSVLTTSTPPMSPAGHPVACTESLTGVRVIPSRLPSGQLAFVVPTLDYLNYVGQLNKAWPGASVGSCDTSSLSPGYLSRAGEVSSPHILYREAMCPSGCNNVQATHSTGNVWRPW